MNPFKKTTIIGGIIQRGSAGGSKIAEIVLEDNDEVVSVSYGAGFVEYQIRNTKTKNVRTEKVTT